MACKTFDAGPLSHLSHLSHFLLPTLDNLVAAIAPRLARLTAKFWVRGGIFTTVVAEHRAKGWKPQPAVELGKFADESSVTERN